MTAGVAGRYRDVADSLLARIRAGDIAPGELLPSENTLVREFGCARATVQRALDVLRGKGLIDTYQGVGSILRATATAAATVQPGEVRVAQVRVLLDAPYARAWHVELRTKYAQIGGSSDNEVFLVAGEETRDVDEARRGVATVIRLDVPEGWFLITDCARYTCRIVAYNGAHGVG